jgi:hypothetical protein
MLVELVERLGHSFDWWLEQPLAFHRLCFNHLQEIDRRRGWVTRAGHIDSAWLNAKGFHEPDSLRNEKQSHIASAAGTAAETTALERANAMLAEFERGNTLDGLTYREH